MPAAKQREESPSPACDRPVPSEKGMTLIGTIGGMSVKRRQTRIGDRTA